MASMPSTFSPNPVDTVALDLEQIQGNILAGFNKDHQRFLFFHIADVAKAKLWLRSMMDSIAMTNKVKAFNDSFKLAKVKAGGHENGTMPVATWRNIAFNYPGLHRLGATGLHSFPAEFKEGMAARSRLLGDVGRNAPDLWDPWLQDRELLHVILLLAADRPDDLAADLAKVMATVPTSGLRLIHTQAGEAPSDVPANEHFGFRDGISQPGVKGFTLSVNPPLPKTGHQGVPGQDLLWPGEFVLGYATQNPERPPADFDGPNPAPVAAKVNGPAWARNGSFLVFRKLQQDVAGFRNSIGNNAAMLKVDPELLGAKLVGRFRSGCPMEHTKDEPASLDSITVDPSVADPTLLTPNKINNFEYSADLQGDFLPRAGHVRKAYPRDEQTLLPDGKEDTTQNHLHESNTQTHRVLRRGIPFGPILPFPKDEETGETLGLGATFTDDQEVRGLLFLAYQHSIAEQFEFIQSQWVNRHDFPDFGDGVDPVMSQVTQAPMQCPFTKAAPTTFELKHFVTTNGGEYFFQPSKDALKELAG